MARHHKTDYPSLVNGSFTARFSLVARVVLTRPRRLIDSTSILMVTLTASPARVHIHPLITLAALDLAAPLEFTVTFALPPNCQSIVTPPTAHCVTAVGTWWRHVTLATSSARWPWTRHGANCCCRTLTHNNILTITHLKPTENAIRHFQN